MTDITQNDPTNIPLNLAWDPKGIATVTFEPPEGITINSGNPMTFNSGNWNTPQNLNVTGTELGSQNIPYKVRCNWSPDWNYREGTVPVFVEEGGVVQISGGMTGYCDSFPGGDANAYTRFCYHGKLVIPYADYIANNRRLRSTCNSITNPGALSGLSIRFAIVRDYDGTLATNVQLSDGSSSNSNLTKSAAQTSGDVIFHIWGSWYRGTTGITHLRTSSSFTGLAASVTMSVINTSSSVHNDTQKTVSISSPHGHIHTALTSEEYCRPSSGSHEIDVDFSRTYEGTIYGQGEFLYTGDTVLKDDYVSSAGCQVISYDVVHQGGVTFRMFGDYSKDTCVPHYALDTSTAITLQRTWPFYSVGEPPPVRAGAYNVSITLSATFPNTVCP